MKFFPFFLFILILISSASAVTSIPVSDMRYASDVFNTSVLNNITLVPNALAGAARSGVLVLPPSTLNWTYKWTITEPLGTDISFRYRVGNYSNPGFAGAANAWLLNDTTANGLRDYTANGRDAVLANTGSLVRNTSGLFELDGALNITADNVSSGQVIAVPGPYILPDCGGTGNFTVFARAKPKQIDGPLFFSKVVSYANTPTTENLAIMVNSGASPDTWRFDVFGFGAGPTSIPLDNTSYQDLVLRCYFDSGLGVSVAEGFVNAQLGITSIGLVPVGGSLNTFVFGGRDTGTGYFNIFNGSIDEVIIANYSWSDQEIIAKYLNFSQWTAWSTLLPNTTRDIGTSFNATQFEANFSTNMAALTPTLSSDVIFTNATAPFVSNVTINNGSLNATRRIDPLQLTFNVTDPDNETIINQIIWYIGNTSQPSYENLTVIPANIPARDEVWHACITPSDPLLTGNTACSQNITIVQNPPGQEENDMILAITIFFSVCALICAWFAYLWYLDNKGKAEEERSTNFPLLFGILFFIITLLFLIIYAQEYGFIPLESGLTIVLTVCSILIVAYIAWTIISLGKRSFDRMARYKK